MSHQQFLPPPAPAPAQSQSAGDFICYPLPCSSGIWTGQNFYEIKLGYESTLCYQKLKFFGLVILYKSDCFTFPVSVNGLFIFIFFVDESVCPFVVKSILQLDLKPS